MLLNKPISCYLIRKTLKTYNSSLKVPSSGENKLIFPIKDINFLKTVPYFKCIKKNLINNNFYTLKLRKNKFSLASKKNGVPLQKGAWFSFLKWDSRGFLFGGSIYLWEHMCKLSAGYYFFPDKATFWASSTGLL